VRLAEPPGRQTPFATQYFAFEAAAGTIHGVIATDSELTGAGLQGFLGFFDQRFRDHDYDVGRTHARQVLTDPALNEPGAMGPLRYTSSDVSPYRSAARWSKVKSKFRLLMCRSFKEGPRKRLSQMLRELWGPYLSLPAVPVADLILDSALNYLIARL